MLSFAYAACGCGVSPHAALACPFVHARGYSAIALSLALHYFIGLRPSCCCLCRATCPRGASSLIFASWPGACVGHRTYLCSGWVALPKVHRMSRVWLLHLVVVVFSVAAVVYSPFPGDFSRFCWWAVCLLKRGCRSREGLLGIWRHLGSVRAHVGDWPHTHGQ